jgi:hypothetical protein
MERCPISDIDDDLPRLHVRQPTCVREPGELQVVTVPPRYQSARRVRQHYTDGEPNGICPVESEGAGRLELRSQPRLDPLTIHRTGEAKLQFEGIGLNRDDRLVGEDRLVRGPIPSSLEEENARTADRELHPGALLAHQPPDLIVRERVVIASWEPRSDGEIDFPTRRQAVQPDETFLPVLGPAHLPIEHPARLDANMLPERRLVRPATEVEVDLGGLLDYAPGPARPEGIRPTRVRVGDVRNARHVRRRVDQQSSGFRDLAGPVATTGDQRGHQDLAQEGP